MISSSCAVSFLKTPFGQAADASRYTPWGAIGDSVPKGTELRRFPFPSPAMFSRSSSVDDVPAEVAKCKANGVKVLYVSEG